MLAGHGKSPLRSWGEGKGLDFHDLADFVDAVGRELEVIGGVFGVFAEEDEEVFPPEGHPGLFGDHDIFFADKEGGLFDGDGEFRLVNAIEDFFNFWGFHESKLGGDSVKAFPLIDDGNPLFWKDVGERGVGADGEENIFLVENLVMLDVFDQGVGSPCGIAGEKDGGALAAVEFVLFIDRSCDGKRGDKIVERHPWGEAFLEESPAVSPSDHDGEDHGTGD